MAVQQFCLRWNDHQSTLITEFDKLLENGTLVDCTLAAEGQYVKAHRVVLSASSPYLETLLGQHYDKHPIVILKDVKLSELKSIIDYMYHGEVNISEDQLESFLKAAESLQMKGLSDNPIGVDASDVGSMSKVPPPRKHVTATHPTEPQQPHFASDNPVYRLPSEGSVSPTSRKRRKIRRNSYCDNLTVEGSNSNNKDPCVLPSQVKLIINPDTATSSITATSKINTQIVKLEHSGIENSIIPSTLNLLQFESEDEANKNEAIEVLSEPKTECFEYINTEDVQDLTLDDDDDERDVTDISYMSNISKPGLSTNMSWQSVDNTSATNISMTIQQAPSGSQGVFTEDNNFRCTSCGKSYQYKKTLIKHQRYECGDKWPFACSLCSYAAKQNISLRLHMINKHKQIEKRN